MSGLLGLDYVRVPRKIHTSDSDPTTSKVSLMESFTASKSSSSPRSTKSYHPLDLSALLTSLPPNTGPPETTAVTSGTGLLAHSNKNLRHVPCKFFRQGICQAGKSCPFSHNLEGTSAADRLPCKYFQKGNCKFGLKCALAHILPDGTRVNPKSSSSSRRNTDRSERLPHSSSLHLTSNNATFDSALSLASEPATVSGLTSQKKSAEGLPSHKNESRTSKNAIQFGSDLSPPGPISLSRPGMTGFFDKRNNYAGQDWLTKHSSEYSSKGGISDLVSSNISFTAASLVASLSGEASPTVFTTHFEGTNGFTSRFEGTNGFTTPITDYLSPIQDFGQGILLASAFTHSAPSSPLHHYIQSTYQESAILDDESDDKESDSDAYYEDYVPASLGNILFTPQENQRRASRSQSGTLLVRPVVVAPGTNTHLNTSQKNSDGVFLMD